MLLRLLSPRASFALACLIGSVAPFTARAQQLPIPSPAQAQQALRNDPSLIGRLQQMMQSSGLTPDQIRDRLRAQGYPDSLLDQYLPGGRPDSTTVPGDDVFAAVRSLGLGDSTALDSLANRSRVRRRTVAHGDSALLDTLRRALQNESTRSAVRAVLASRHLQQEFADSGFQVFAADLFRSDSTAFNASSASAGADPNYRFGPGDKLALILTGDVQKSYSLSVTREGFVVIPDVGQITVAGLTRAQLEDVLYSRLGRVYSGVRRGGGTTHFYLDVSQIGTNQVFITGDVLRPGSLQISRAGTVLNALYQAGGPTATGTLRGVQVRRGGTTVATLDFYDYALRGDATNDVRLESGDVIFIPPRHPQVRVAGNVVRPATYELAGDQSLANVIQMAGGFTETADRRRVQIDRVVPPSERTTAGADRKVVDVPSDLFASAPVRGGDVVRVLGIAEHVASRVTVVGNVWTPGALGFAPGMHLHDALRRVGGLKPDSYLGQVLITRLRPDSTREMFRTAMYDTTGRPVENFELSDGDEISVFSTTDFRPRRYVTVNGAVRKPGPVPYREGMTMRDALLLAGGPTEGALLTEAELARLPENRGAGVTAITQVVPMDSSYAFDRGGVKSSPAGRAFVSSTVSDVVLQPYDAVLIKRQTNWQLQQTVAVDGEVNYPGAYSLIKSTEKLSEIIRRAGGLTGAAYAQGIVFIRKRDDIGRIGVDLPAVLQNSSSIDNLELVNGDSIFIPRFSPVVTVRGAVHSLVGVAFVDGANMDYYIRSAGGETPDGDRGKAYVTQPNGKVETNRRRLGFWSLEPRPQPGSTVIVPKKDPNDRRDWLTIATAFTSILGSLVAISAIVKR
jgi:polysaccharide biosynthesis/export protein